MRQRRHRRREAGVAPADDRERHYRGEVDAFVERFGERTVRAVCRALHEAVIDLTDEARDDLFVIDLEEASATGIEDAPWTGPSPGDRGWDVVVNEVTARLDLRDVPRSELLGRPPLEPYLETLLPQPGFRQALAGWEEGASYAEGYDDRSAASLVAMQAIERLADLDWSGCEQLLDELGSLSADVAGQLREELPIRSSEAAMTPDLEELAVRVWRVLDPRSPCDSFSRVRDLRASAPASATATAPLEGEIDAGESAPETPAAPSPRDVGTKNALQRDHPQREGQRLERAMRQLLHQLFQLDDPSATNWEMRL